MSVNLHCKNDAHLYTYALSTNDNTKKVLGIVSLLQFIIFQYSYYHNKGNYFRFICFSKKKEEKQRRKLFHSNNFSILGFLFSFFFFF